MAWRVIVDYRHEDTVVLDFRREPKVGAGEGFVRIADGEPLPAPRGEQFSGELWVRSDAVERIRVINLDTDPPQGFLEEQEILAH